MSSQQRSRPNEPIAVIGSGFRFPGGADTPSKLWELLREPRDVQSAIPKSRFNSEGFSHPANDGHGARNTQHGYFLLEDHRQFDAQFFGITPIEANSMDPQQRLLLEVIYESVEASGLSMETLRGSATAVYVGLMSVDYTDMLNRDTSYFPSYIAPGTARSMMANRVSYFFDWRGPSMTIDTACSSSLVAVHQAVSSLRSGDSKIAVAAGANLLLGPETFIAGSNMKMLSPDGRSYMWDTRANGYARGEGVAAVVLKTLSAAIADGDDIECLIMETGLNQDGKTKGLTVPSATAQATLIDATYKKAGLDLTKDSDRPQYFEAHGTGTPTGDPIEAEAIHNTFFKKNAPHHVTSPLYVGSIKTIIGHTEGTAGLAGLIKASLALKNGFIPPNRLFENLAPGVKPFYDNLEIVTKTKPWPALDPGTPRRASVNSFGFGGTNAHCILESYDSKRCRTLSSSPAYYPFPFSAASERTLYAVVTSYCRYLKSDPSVDLRALSHTLCNRRTAFPFRVVFSADDVGDLCHKLESFVEGSCKELVPTIAKPASPLRILGIFTGQGAQWVGMASKLMKVPASAKIVDDLERSLSELVDPPSWSLKAELSADRSSSRITDAKIAQPACTAVQILLVELLRAVGIGFNTVVGHSSGEIGAAYAAGYLTARDAIRIAYYRGVHLDLVQGKDGERGSMIAVGASYEEAKKLCNLDEFRGRICVAASNSASSVTLSGDTIAIEGVRALFQGQNKFARILRVDNAYHSHHMSACSEAITASLRRCQIKAHSPSHSVCTWISSVYPRDIAQVTDDLNDIYWHSNTVGPVLFSQALAHALKNAEFDLAVELGPHPALKGPASQVIEDTLGHSLPYTGILSRNVNDVEAFSGGLGYIWANFGDNIVDFTGYDRLLNESGPPEILKGLPTYPWEHQRAFWHESRTSQAYRHRCARHELLGNRSLNYSEDHVSWTNHLIPKELSWIAGHRIQGQMIFPGAGYMSSAFEAAREVATHQHIMLIELTNFVFGQPLVFDNEDSRVEVFITLTDIRRESFSLSARFSYYSTTNKEPGPMSLNASCQLNIAFGDPDANALQSIPKQQFGMTEVDSERIYSSFANCGYYYTGDFQALTAVERKLGVATGLVQVPKTASRKSLLIHPATLDAAMHSIIVAYCYPGDGRLASIPLPTDISRVSINPTQVVSYTSAHALKFVSSISNDDGKRTEGDVCLFPIDGSNAVLQLEGLHTKAMISATAANDVQLFSETVWGPASPIQHSGLHMNNTYTDGCVNKLAAIVKQISHRHSAMNILKVRAGADDNTIPILEELNGAFASYTYTDISTENLEHAKEALQVYETKIVFKTLDTKSDAIDQGYIGHTFDLVIARITSDTTAEIDDIMKQARKLLKPGGYFLLEAVEKQQLRSDSPVGAIHENQLGLEEKDSSLSCINVPKWIELVQNYGFAGVDWMAAHKSSASFPCNLMITQAVDDRIRFLRSPLSYLPEGVQFPGAVFIGGATGATSRCLSDIKNTVTTHFSSLYDADALENIDNLTLPFGGTVLLLQDHDKPIFEDLDEQKLKGLQRLFENAKNVLWITCGYKQNLPYARMAVAFGRCLLQEMSHVRLQFLDLPSPDKLDASIISQHLLRLLMTQRWEEESRIEDILWSDEPETCYENGQEYIPRVKLNKTLNERYNSARRHITRLVDPLMTPVTLAVKDNNYILKSERGLGPLKPSPRANEISILVSHSLLKAIKIETSDYVYLILGTDCTTGEQVLALSSCLSSVIDVPSDLVRSCSVPKFEAAQYLQSLFYNIVSRTMLRNLDRGDSLLILEPAKDLATVIEALASSRGIDTMFFTTKNDLNNRTSWKNIKYHPLSRDMEAVLPRHVSRMVRCQQNNSTSELCKHVSRFLINEDFESYLDVEASPLSPNAISRLSRVLDSVQKDILLMDPGLSLAEVEIVSLAEIQDLSSAGSTPIVVDWTDASEVSMTVEPVDKRLLFRKDKTYWLVGLTGGLGLSLCQWMISRGAQYIAISSRCPKVDPRWNAYFKSLDVIVKVYTNDVTNIQSVRSTYNEIQASMPQIAGVCHGAMVLQDSLFQDLDISQVENTFKPKVYGAMHLDEIFQHQELDFFVMLSSITAVAGNPGQAAYAAANGFLAGVAAQRRARGMAASTMNLGAILGNGYVTQKLTLAQQTALEKAGVMWMSEQDFHQAFAEAVVASPLLPGSSGEICTGIGVCYADDDHKPKHAHNPIFSHLVLHRGVSEPPMSRDEPKISIKTQLLQTKTSEELRTILEKLLISKLRKALEMSPDANILDQSADLLGIDSLVAVEMRSWFLKLLNIDMPVLKIIGGGTMREVVEKAQELLDPAMTPALDKKIH